MRISCCRRFHFCMGHRLLGHEGKCENLHGHNYIAEIYAEAEQLDHLGRVIDFSILKHRIGGWIKDNWDHGFTRAAHDQVMADILKIAQSKEFVLPYNPTAENLAQYLLTDVCPQMLSGTGVVVTRLILWETPDCFVDCRL